jgi:hypothetical protein
MIASIAIVSPPKRAIFVLIRLAFDILLWHCHAIGSKTETIAWPGQACPSGGIASGSWWLDDQWLGEFEFQGAQDGDGPREPANSKLERPVPHRGR